MKLKGLGNRAYNIMHHTHTVTGLMISLVLFIIFFAGAYTMFRAEIQQWENPEARNAPPENIDFDRVLQSFIQQNNLEGIDPIRIYPAHEGHPEFEANTYTEKPDGTYGYIFGHMDSETYQFETESEDSEPQTIVSQTLYELHFLNQIPTYGLFITGFAGFFFLLATITGLLIHWRNIFDKFYAFFVGKRWKQIWTDAHTVVGMISLPFQVMYAITGALFGLTIFLLLPSVMVMFGGDQTPIYSAIQPERGLEVNEDAPMATMVSLNQLVETVQDDFPEQEIVRMTLTNYGRQDAIVSFDIDDHMGLMGSGSISYEMVDGTMLEEMSHIPYEKSYDESVYALLVKLHFGSYGGVLLRIIYFLLSLLTCFMIISGVLIWQVAREKKRYTDKQRRFQHRITKLNLTVCLSLFPAIAILFIANKVVPLDIDGRAGLVEQIFFISWLVLAVAGWFWDQYSQMTKNYFLIGGVLSFFVPILNGVVTGDWVWNSWSKLPAVAGIDLLWLISGIVAIWTTGQITIQNKNETESTLAT